MKFLNSIAVFATISVISMIAGDEKRYVTEQGTRTSESERWHYEVRTLTPNRTTPVSLAATFFLPSSTPRPVTMADITGIPLKDRKSARGQKKNNQSIKNYRNRKISSMKKNLGKY